MNDTNLWRTELRALLKLAGPLVLISVGWQTMGIVDTAVVGRVSDAALGAVGLANGLFFTPSVLGLGLMMGLDPLIAQALGAKDEARARRLAMQSVWLALGVSLVLTPPLWAVSYALPHCGISPEIAQLTERFLSLRLFALFPVLLFIGARSYLQALGRTAPLLWATIVANVLNFAGDLFFVFGGAGLPAWTGVLRHFPALGVRGAALSTVLCSTAQAVWVMVSIARRKQVIWRGPDRAELREAFRVGLPVGLQISAEVGIFTLAGLLVGRLGASALAAHQVALQIASFTFMGAYGLSGAASVRVGLKVGASDLQGVRRAGVLALVLAVSWMGLCALGLLAVPGAFARTLTDQPQVVLAALPLLRVVAAFQLSDGLQSVATGLLRGAGNTRIPFIANVAGHYFLGLPVGIWLGLRHGLGVVGIWWGLALGLTVVAALLIVRFALLARRPIAPLRIPERALQAVP